MSALKITIPDMGDFKDVEIIEVLVKEGQTVKKNDSLITLESDKSSVEVPSIHAGKIEKINLKIGDKVNKGDLILTIRSETQEETKKVNKDEVKEIKKPVPKKEVLTPPVSKAKDGVKLASPKVRKFARELGANVVQIPGSQRAGRVSEEDVKVFIKSQVSVNHGIVEKKIFKEEYSYEEFGHIEIKDIPRVKKLSGPHLVRSWTEIPHVTQHEEIDITEMENFRSSLYDYFTGEKIKVTPLAFIAKALAIKASGVTLIFSPV